MSNFKSDIEIAQATPMQHITEVAKTAGIDAKYLEQYGNYKAKVDYNILNETPERSGKLILVTAINPTPAGEGKTTTTVGLADGLKRLGKNVLVALREPSLRPRGSASRAAPPAAAMPRWCPWRISTSTSPATSTPSARPTTCWPPCWIITSTRATSSTLIPAGSPGAAAWT